MNDKKKYKEIHLYLELVFILISGITIGFYITNIVKNTISLGNIIISIVCILILVSLGLISYSIDNYFYKRSIFFIKSVSIKDRKRCYSNNCYTKNFYMYTNLKEIIPLIKSIEPIYRIKYRQELNNLSEIGITNKIYKDYMISLCTDNDIYLKIHHTDDVNTQIYLSPSEFVKLERWLYLKMLRS